jgi:hypothetical protein
MNTHVRTPAPSAVALTREEVAELLIRYPQVSGAEAKLILTFLRKGRHLDVGMLTSDEQLKPHLDRFTADHAHHFRLSVGEASTVVAAIAGFLVICWLVWEAIRPAVSQL